MVVSGTATKVYDVDNVGVAVIEVIAVIMSHARMR